MDASKICYLVKEIKVLFQLSNAESSKLWVKTLDQVEGKLSIENSILNGLNMLKSYLGGMGSLNDVYFCEDNGNIPKGYTSESANIEFGKRLKLLVEEFSKFKNNLPAA
jgi:hypothetical protein